MSANKTIRPELDLPGGINAPYKVDTEVAANATANLYRVLPVSTTGAARTITPPTPGKAGDWFAVVDSRANANTNNITVDFSATIKFQGATNDYVISTAGGAAIFVYSGAPAVGYFRLA